MLISEAIASVRSATLHEEDEQFLDEQLRDDCLADEYRRLRTWLCTFVPSLCEAVVSGIAVASGSGAISKDDLERFERLCRVERWDGSTYWPVSVATGLYADNPWGLAVREQPDQLLLTPAQYADGTYRVVYVAGTPDAIEFDTEIELPAALCRVLIERGCAWVCNRHGGDRERLPYHQKRADDLMAEAHVTLVQRYGDQGESGLRRDGYFGGV